MSRDDFTPKTIIQIAKRAGWLCSFPGCRAHTVGATEDGQGEINIGTAAHICAAAPGGPRYSDGMTANQRSSANNGMWLCRDHGKIIDSDPQAYPAELLHEWRQQAMIASRHRVTRDGAMQDPVVPAATDVPERVRRATEADLRIFSATEKWPQSPVAHLIRMAGVKEPVSTRDLADIGAALEDLLLVAPPGMGKTTALFQIANGVLTNGKGTPLFVSLSDWATENRSLLESILRRPSFRGITEEHLREAAARPGVVLLLDGWNELNEQASTRARVEVKALQASLPQLGLIVSTRQQAGGVPFQGTQAVLQPLNEHQQMEIATALRGRVGCRFVDQAWRTPGVRELVTIPLYLTALLSLPEGTPFPITKEEVLRHFVAAHQRQPEHADALNAVIDGFQQAYLEELAVFATRSGMLTVADNNARSSISATAASLRQHGQIEIPPTPNAALSVLVCNHLLTRADDSLGYSFQHQQFQEWYASHWVERRIIDGAGDPNAREALKKEILDIPIWEESILFAIERLSRTDQYRQAACGRAILAAFEVDPMLAAEMIYRATDEVWTQISPSIVTLVKRWHAVGKVDRAFRFMLTSGHLQFLEAVWPLMTNNNEQVSLKALRNCIRFRPSILGPDAAAKIRGLPQRPRRVFLHEIASHSGMDGLDLAVSIAKDDPDPEVQVTVAEAMAFRRADRHVAEILENASDATFELMARRDFIDEVRDDMVRERLEAARKRNATRDTAYDRLRGFAYGPFDEAYSDELAHIVSVIELDDMQGPEVGLIHKARDRYPNAVAAGLLARVRAGISLFYGADDLLAASGLVLDDDELVEIALANPDGRDGRSGAAASILGPASAGLLLDELLSLAPRERIDREASDACSKLRSLIAHVPGSSLAAAAATRSPDLRDDQIAVVAHVLAKGRDDDGSGPGRPLNVNAIETVQGLVQDWGNRLLATNDVRRCDRAEVVTLARFVASPALLPLLRRLLDDELARYRKVRVQAAAERWQGDIANEARMFYAHQHQRAFMAIMSPETAAMMGEYLLDEDFGELAAVVLADRWRQANESSGEKPWYGRDEFANVAAKRADKAANPEATCEEAETIFIAIEHLLQDGATDQQQKLALSLGLVACRLPHGRRTLFIAKLIARAPRRLRAELLAAIVSSGAVLNTEMVAAGIAETVEAAKQERWILDGDAYDLRRWTRLLPFIERLSALPGLLRNLDPVRRNRQFLEDIIHGLSLVGSWNAEELLFKLAAEEPQLYQDYDWRKATMRFGTATSKLRLLDLAADGALNGRPNDWRLGRELGALLDNDAEARRYIYGRLSNEGRSMPGWLQLAEAVAESPDEEGLLLLVRIELETQQSLVSWRTIESVITDHVPAEGFQNAYNIVPRAVGELRSKLLKMTSGGGPLDRAARHLNHIDSIRDEHGKPETEPRHPDLASRRAWPVMTPDPQATAD